MSNSSSDTSLLGKIASYTEILNKDAHSTAFVPLSDSYRQMGLLDDALEVAEKGVCVLPRFSPGYVILGRIHFDRDDMPAAAAAFESAHAIDSESLSAIKGLVRVLVRLGKHERAQELLEKAAKLNPDDPSIAKMRLSVSPRPSGKSIPSIPPTESPKVKEPIATSTIAEIYLKQGFPHRALKVYEDLQAIHPDNEELRQKIIEVAKLTQDVEKKVSMKDDLSVASITVNPSTTVASIQSINPVKPALEPISAVESASVADRQVETLSHWLTAIRVRRQHVLQ
jgi:tetratricopeptide (TPR) repeat protein